MAKKKAAAKTETAKKKPATKAAKPSIPDAPPHQFFILLDGRVLKNYKELADVLDDMADHIYGHHVNPQRNDFSNWIHDVFNEKQLAENLRHAQGKHHSQIIIYRHILERL